MKLRSLKAHLIQVHILIYVHIMTRISGPAARGEVPALLANVQRSAAAAAALCNLCCEDAARNKALRMSASVNATWALPLDAALYVRPSPRTPRPPSPEGS